MKRNQGDFKRKPAKHQPHPDIDQRILCIGIFMKELSDHLDFGRSTTGVDQGHAINQNG